MPSTINATTNGIVTIGDSVATLSLQTGGTTAVAISTSQIVTLSKSLALLGSTSGSVTIAAPATAGTQSYTLPTAQPTANGQALTATTAGVMSWATAGGGTPGGSDTQVQYNSGGTTFAGSANFIWDNTNIRLGVGGNPSAPLHVQGGTAATAFDTALFGNSGGSAGASAKIYLSGANVLTRAAVIEGLVTSAGPNAHDLVFYTNAGSAAPTESMRITSGATVILKGGSTSATGVGITFPATASLSTNANTLDDYEEGAWIPTDSSGAGLTITTYSQTRYVRVGSLVTCTGTINYPTTSSTALAQVTLPFTAANETGVTPLQRGGSILYQCTGNGANLQFWPVYSYSQATNANLSGILFIVSFSYHCTV